ncbi:hypothetical protein [Streptomyces sp. RK9]|uniref:hypothetical protein n=1 Tax=Streptomyces sp. RK9 TaxID=3239284 RepID=UPI0038696217
MPPPRSGTAGGDIAGLRIVGEPAPAGAGPARLPLADASAHGGEGHVFGHPAQPVRRDGSWVAARVGGGLLQVDGGLDSAVRLQPGYLPRTTGLVFDNAEKSSTWRHGP